MKLWGKSWLSQAPCAPSGHCPAIISRTRLRSDVCLSGRNCCNSITLQSIGLIPTNPDSVICKYQTGAMSTICDSPTDAIGDWALIVCAGVLQQRLSSWLMNVLAVGSLCVFPCGHCKYAFISKQNHANIISSTGEYLFSNCFEL